MSHIDRPDEVTGHYASVKRFMQLAKQGTPDKPVMPPEEVLLLRARLILEETLETIQALGVSVSVRSDTGDYTELDERINPIRITQAIFKPDLEAIADGCADLSVVNIGTLVACGIADAELLRQVDENNLRKFRHICPNCGKDYTDLPPESTEVICSVQPMKTTRHEPGMWQCAGENGCGTEWRSGYRREDGKWVKPEGHKPPPIAALLRAQKEV